MHVTSYRFAHLQCRSALRSEYSLSEWMFQMFFGPCHLGQLSNPQHTDTVDSLLKVNLSQCVALFAVWLILQSLGQNKKQWGGWSSELCCFSHEVSLNFY